MFNAFDDKRCFMLIQVYDAASGHCVMTILRPGKTPDGQEVRAHLRRLVHRIRRHWPNTVIIVRGNSHYGSREAIEWCAGGVAFNMCLGWRRTRFARVRFESATLECAGNIISG